MKLSWKQRSSVVVSALLLVLPWLVFQFESIRVQRTMQELLQAKVIELDRQLGQYAVVPRILSSHPSIQSAAINPSPNPVLIANQALLQARSDSKAAFAFLLDTDGTTIASSNFDDEVSFIGQNYGFRPYFKGALAGEETTFFAVGATTGIPGYFIANAVYHNGEVVGVVVVKFDLNQIPNSWRQPSFSWQALDEFGVVILATNSELLYTPTLRFSEESLTRITEDRRYSPNDSARYITKNEELTRYVSETNEQSFLMQQSQLVVENWTLRILHERARIWARALMYLFALAALGSIAALVVRSNRTQSRLVAVEQRHAMQLEAQVEERTRELRSAQDELISESNFAMLGRMSGAINHEINQPLASLRMNLATLRSLFEQKNPDLETLEQIVVDSDRTTKRIGRVVTTLRSLSGQRRVDKFDIDVQRLLDDVTDTIKRERPHMSKILSVHILEERLVIQGNDVLMTQALLNLLYNALDAVLDIDQPQVTLSVSGSVEFKVTDNGRGVSEDIRKNLFKPFVSDKHRTTGMGLGLTLAELIAKEHGGTLSYQPTQSGGSEFILCVPMKNETVRTKQVKSSVRND